MQTVLTIAGYDPSSGAGITADLMVFAAHGLFGTSAITALTVQSTQGVRVSYPVDADVLGQTLECLDADLPPAGVKIGMVGTSANIFIISRYIATMKEIDSMRPVVLDPVLVSSSGRRLLDSEGVESLKVELLPLAGWVTPNAEELAVLTGQQIRCTEDLAKGARVLHDQVGVRVDGAGVESRIGVLAKGGHLDKPD